MPQKDKPLSTQQVAAVRAWIEQGAHWPRDLVLQDRRFDGRKWWSFEPLRRPVVPSVHGSDWVRTPIDAFVLSTLEKHGLKPSPEADRRTLIRRLSFDLLGLPPAPEEVDAFAQDSRPFAYESLVDRMLASPHHGERWGRHWLDVVHYGDTHGYDKDKRPRPRLAVSRLCDRLVQPRCSLWPVRQGTGCRRRVLAGRTERRHRDRIHRRRPLGFRRQR